MISWFRLFDVVNKLSMNSMTPKVQQSNIFTTSVLTPQWPPEAVRPRAM